VGVGRDNFTKVVEEHQPDGSAKLSTIFSIENSEFCRPDIKAFKEKSREFLISGKEKTSGLPEGIHLWKPLT
jgi:hypothetical protein